jgi:hypothetical protein
MFSANLTGILSQIGAVYNCLDPHISTHSSTCKTEERQSYVTAKESNTSVYTYVYMYLVLLYFHHLTFYTLHINYLYE